MRPRERRPRGASYTFACVKCRLVLDDGVEYAWCPACGRAVDWVARERPAWGCGRCDVLVVGGDEQPACVGCGGPMADVAAPAGKAVPPRRPAGARSVAWWLLGAAVALQAVLGLVMPEAFPYLAAWLVLAQIVAACIAGTIALATPSIRALARDQRTRILHGLEHATITLLLVRGFPVRSGCTYDGEFVIDLVNDGRSWGRLGEIEAAVASAIRRIARGEHALAYSETCGTSRMVGSLLLALAVVGAGVAGLALGMPANVGFAITAAACFVARAIRRPLGLWAQRWLTVSTALHSATIRAIDREVSSTGGALRITVALDVVPRDPTGEPVSPLGLS